MHQDENLLDLLERLCYKGFSFPFNRVYYVEQLVFWEWFVITLDYVLLKC